MAILLLEKYAKRLFKRLDLVLLAGIGAGAPTAVIAFLWLLFAFVMDRDLLSFLFPPLIIAAPFLGGGVALLMATDYSKLTSVPEAQNFEEQGSSSAKEAERSVAV
jgi:hypothetical protein